MIPGGENIFPAEIEERLLTHSAIAEVSVIGLPDEKYGEIVGCFLRAVEGETKPGDAEIRQWVGSKLGRHKIPTWIFWIGQQGVADDFPKTGSGKHQKHLLRALGVKLLDKVSHVKQPDRAKL